MEHFVVRLADAQRRMGHDARVVALKSGPLLEQAEAIGLPTYVLHRSGKLDRIVRGVVRLATLRPDIIHSHNPTSLHYSVLGKLVSGGRIVFTDHAQTRGIVRVPRDLEWHLTDAVVAVSQDTADKSGANGLAPEITVLHNGIDIKPAKRTRAEVRAELGLAEGEVVGVNVAGFVPVKAQDVLARAMGELDRRGVRLTVLTVGDGPERAGVEALAKELGLGASLRFLGFRTDVGDLLGAADFFVLPSRNEGLPLSVLEAMSHRLPVVATPVGGNPELCFHGEHGLHVPVEDTAALADAMALLAADPALRRRLGEAGYARVRDEFSFDGMTRRYEAIYYRVLEPGLVQQGITLLDRLRQGRAA